MGYSRKESPTTSDLAFIWDADNSNWKLTTLSNVFTLFSESFLNVVEEPDTQYSAPAVTDFDITVNANNNDTHLILKPESTLAAGTITLPTAANLRDKQLFICNCTQQVTALTIEGNGVTVNGGPTSLSADDFFTLKYDLTLNAWNRIS